MCNQVTLNNPNSLKKKYAQRWIAFVTIFNSTAILCLRVLTKCELYRHVFKQYYGWQCFGFLTSKQMLTNMTAHWGCANTVWESLCAESWFWGQKVPCCTREWHLHQQQAGPITPLNELHPCPSKVPELWRSTMCHWGTVQRSAGRTWPKERYLQKQPVIQSKGIKQYWLSTASPQITSCFQPKMDLVSLKLSSTQQWTKWEQQPPNPHNNSAIQKKIQKKKKKKNCWKYWIPCFTTTLEVQKLVFFSCDRAR